MKISYKEAGVDIDAGNSLVNRIKPFIRKTFNENVVGDIGSFAGAFKIPKGYKNPVLLSSTDGVGTKIKIAIEARKFDTIGIDLVAMCVNDLICNFAIPMFFLDYYATGKLDVDTASEVIKGIAKGCIEAECALIGGESAEMPGMYSENDFDLAGFAVGIAEEEDLKRRVKENDILIALPSSGIHSNGYSLVRKLLFEKLNLKLDDEIDGKKLVDILLTPTKIYVKDFKKIRDLINGLAHITGGGIVENLPRILGNLGAKIYKSKIKPLPIFEFISKYVEEEEMFRTFNMGVGMIIAVEKRNVDEVLSKIDGYIIGEITNQKGVTLL